MDNPDQKSILIVDDEIIQIKALAHLLENEYTIHIAKSGKDAIEIAEKHTPDLILLDVLMPDMDGYETISHLKSNSSTSNIPVVFTTGLRDEEDEVKGLEHDIADYITKPFNPKIVRLRVRNQMKIINQMRAIERLSRIDQLSEIPNRRYFVERLETDWGSSIRKYQPLSILILDIDFFKKYNDTYGHQQGDVAIRETARILTESLNRPGDFAARYGGEEFVVLLPDTDQSGALQIAERIRKSIEAAEIPKHESTSENSRITVSIGVNTIVPRVSDSMDMFISRADNALYTSKQNGRNQVSAYVSEIE